MILIINKSINEIDLSNLISMMRSPSFNLLLKIIESRAKAKMAEAINLYVESEEDKISEEYKYLLNEAKKYEICYNILNKIKNDNNLTIFEIK